MVMMVDMTDFCTFILSKCLTTLSTWELVVDDIMEDNDNLKKKTGEDAVIRMYRLEFFGHFSLFCHKFTHFLVPHLQA